MEKIIYSSPETAPVDNLTIIKRLPYEGKKSAYYASNYGQILSYNSKRWKVINSFGKRSNYGAISHCSTQYVQIRSRCLLRSKYLHRLVADAFCPGRTKLRKQVDHIDNNPRNNRADNLRWCTQRENKRYAREIRTGERVISALDKARFYVKQ